MDRCAMEFIARRWWRRVEVWVIAALLVAGGSVVGFQAGQWSLASWYTKQVSDVRAGYDEALSQRDLRLTKLADRSLDAAEKVEAAATSATQAADTASRAADKVNEAVERANQ